MKKDTTIAVIFLLIAYPLVVVAAHLTQSYAIFQSRGAFHRPPSYLNIDEVVLTTPDGERLHAWWLRTKQAVKTVLYFQENGTNISFRTLRLNTLKKMGLNAFLIDYRVYGKSTGRIKNEQDTYTDGLTAWHFLTVENHIDPQDIIIWGQSMGGGVAAEIAQFKTISALVLESTFHSLDEIARRQYWFLPTGWFLKFHFDNRSKLKNIAAPIVIIHSVKDDDIPFSQATRLLDDANPPKHILKAGGSHLELFDNQPTAVCTLKGYLGL